MNNIIKFITIAILFSTSLLAVNAQEETVVVSNEGATATEKVEKKKETTKKQSSSDDDSWTGFYVGGFGGYSHGKASANTSTVFNPTAYFNQVSVNQIGNVGNQKIKTNGFNGGGTFGYNYQKGKFLIGAETDFGANRINKSVSSTETYSGLTRSFTITQSVKSDWLLTVRSRTGVALKKVLVYGTGGVAITNTKYNETFSDTVIPPASQSGSFIKTKTGWTAGAGMEFKVSSHWSVKGEYLYSQFGRTTITSNNLRGSDFNVSTISYPQNVFTHSTDLKSHSIRFGVNYRF